MSGFWLKLIAMVTMFIDHGTAILVPTDSSFYIVGRSIGRLAFPIFCFLLVEGFLHTSNVKKYLLRLGMFALISEVPFDLAFYHTFFQMGHQNIFFTLLIGLLVLMGIKKTEDCYRDRQLIYALRYGLIIIGGCFAALLLWTDYNYAGVLMILSFYVFRYNKVLLTAALVIIYNYALGGIQILAAFAIIPILFYNGQRGTKINKYVFYGFYPAHILFLFLIGEFFIK
ncbi:MAG: TraX family protein [Anaerocolumna sp.]